MKRVLVIRSGALGDTVFASSILPVLQQSCSGEVEIDWLGRKPFTDIFKYDSRVNRIYSLKHNSIPVWLDAVKLRVIFDSWFNPYDLVVNLETGSKLSLLMRLVKAEQKAGVPYHYIEDLQETHAVDIVRKICSRFTDDKYLEYAVPHLYFQTNMGLLNRFSLERQRYLIIHPGISHFNKHDHRAFRSWPMTAWHELIKNLILQYTGKVVIIGSASERAYLDCLNDFKTEQVVFTAGRILLPDLLILIANAGLLVSTDTGPAHAAAALNTPVIALFGPSSVRTTGPYVSDSNQVAVLSAGLPCSPCSLTERFKSCKNNLCMKKISVSAVLDAIKNICNTLAI